MKNIYIKLLSIFLVAVAIIGCEDEEKDPLFVDSDPNNSGAFVTIAQDPDNLVIDFSDPSSSYNFTIDAPANNITEYDLRVARTSNGVVSDTVSVQKVSTFPADFQITVADLESALGVDDIAPGDQFDFISTATAENGLIGTFEDLNGDATGPGQFQGFNHVTFVICPFSVSEAIGSYSATSETFPFATVSSTFEVSAGPTDDTVVVTGLYDAEKSFTIVMDTALGIATVERQDVKDDFLGYAGGRINTNLTTSFFFSCTGTMILNLQYTVDLGSFGNFQIIAQKN
ncbi:hypothetical protein [Aquimarina pacifica]|uniref:hypothetical protein n=1 Tax=Aquimarina pacifica TaxID=1296415 RepID=UPI00047269B7|nr:hypothetical protein [Aquimarina pacifica]